ncbi:Hypothetical protein FKW44_019114 [Caligus rogercresseyi]|uniref:Uncharacterized protein n=1 Tax=Caligus rogercresseyi TaxID=217165 RepID=A0A7T8GW15_CALRO|nr:Hypothetical protein FKW44_019114 [Caligus rogercresseyi]
MSINNAPATTAIELIVHGVEAQGNHPSEALEDIHDEMMMMTMKARDYRPREETSRDLRHSYLLTEKHW